MTKIKVIDLNRLSYATALYIQNKLFTKVLESSKAQERLNYLLLVEHDPVYTVGIRSKQYVDDTFQTRLKELGADFHVTNRGGLITFHGPGQLVAYPIVNLKDFPVVQNSIKNFVRHLESSIIDVCGKFSVRASRVEGLPGVWVESQRKIAALGLHCSQYVTMHGVAINCDVDLRWFDHIVPCGIENKSTTSLTKETNQKITVNQVKPIFVEKFCENLDCSIVEK